MPFKDKKKRRKYMRKYMKTYRKEKTLVSKKNLEKLEKQFPSAYEMIFGKKKKKRRK